VRFNPGEIQNPKKSKNPKNQNSKIQIQKNIQKSIKSKIQTQIQNPIFFGVLNSKFS
jgi:hypothetical protein